MGISSERMKAIFLDRDGVINKAIIRDGKPYSPSSLSEFELFSDTNESLTLLKNLGYLLIVVTNQPEIARGNLSNCTLDEMHDYLYEKLPIDYIVTCPHDDVDNCLCRKPKTGLIKYAVEKFSIALNKSYMIGDRWKDIEAGISARCKTIYINHNYNEKKPLHHNYEVQSIIEAVQIIKRESTK